MNELLEIRRVRSWRARQVEAHQVDRCIVDYFRPLPRGEGLPEHQTKVTIDADRPRTSWSPMVRRAARRNLYAWPRLIEARNDGREIWSLKKPRASFGRHVRDTKMDQLHVSISSG